MENQQKNPPAVSLLFIIILIMMAIFKMSSNEGNEVSTNCMFISIFLILIITLSTFKLSKDAYLLIFIIVFVGFAIFTQKGIELMESLGIFRCEVLLVTVAIISAILLINMNQWDMSPGATTSKKGSGQVVKQVQIEGFENTDTASQSFCEKYQQNPNELNEQCKKFDKDSCDIPSCCVWLNGKTCVAGNNLGPTFKTEGDDMKDIDVKYYNHQGKCYGDCPN